MTLADSKLSNEKLVWVFHSEDAKSVHPCGVWSSREQAEVWIKRVDAAGILSAYVLDESAYDSNVRLDLLKITKSERLTPEFQRRFSTAVDHHHYHRGDSDVPSANAQFPAPSA